MKSENKLLGAGLLTAVSASLCCITPVLALVGGTSGIASTFSWKEPLRPYLIGLTILVLVVAWYQKLKPKNEIDCACDADDIPVDEIRKSNFMQSKAFLGLVTVFAIIMLAFPYYSGIFFTSTKHQIIVLDQSDIRTTEFKIEGMTCASCEDHVKHEINKLEGIVSAIASYEYGNAVIEFDESKTNASKIEIAINATGYTVTNKKEN